MGPEDKQALPAVKQLDFQNHSPCGPCAVETRLPPQPLVDSHGGK